MVKNKCILFILHNDEKSLIKNMETIYKLKNDFDLFFVVRESKDQTIELLKSNKFNIIHMPYDSGYNEALTIGLDFIQKYNYKSVIEFGDMKSIPINEIERLYQIFCDSKKNIVFGSRMQNKKNNKLNKIKFYI